MSNTNLFATLTALTSKNRSFVLATIVEASGSTPGKESFKAVIDTHGLVAGTVGGGRLEAEVISQAQEQLEKGQNLLKAYNLTSGPENLGMECGGSLTIFYEFFGPRDHALIFGGGHLSQSLAPILKSIDFHITLLENRAEFASRERHPDADEVVNISYGKYIKHARIDPDTFIVIVSPTHKYDIEILEALFETDLEFRYIGVIASRRKAAKIREKLNEIFPGDPRIDRIHAPVGLDIGGETPAQIALSIAAQIQAVRSGKGMAPLKT